MIMCARRHPYLHSLGVLLVVLLFGVLPSPWANARLHAVNPIAGEDQEPEIATDPSFRELKGGLLEGIPEFPAYPGATLIGSAERNKPDEKNRGYRIKWTTTDGPAQVMAWYEKTLPGYGWKYVGSDEPAEVDELEAKITTAAFSGYIEAETKDYPHGDITEIVVVLARK
jgi:hypothetical protein